MLRSHVKQAAQIIFPRPRLFEVFEEKLFSFFTLGDTKGLRPAEETA